MFWKTGITIMRLINIIFCAVIIIGCGFYSYWYSGRHFFSLTDCLRDEEVSDGKEISSNYQRVVEAGPEYVVLQMEDRKVKITGDIEGIKQGDMISFKGIFQKGGTIKLVNYCIVKHRRLKYTVSMLAAFLVFLWLWGNFKIDWRDFIFVERNDERHKKSNRF